nr:unnamed protein product [Spirometra erinaceieuropaei]
MYVDWAVNIVRCISEKIWQWNSVEEEELEGRQEERQEKEEQREDKEEGELEKEHHEKVREEEMEEEKEKRVKGRQKRDREMKEHEEEQEEKEDEAEDVFYDVELQCAEECWEFVEECVIDSTGLSDEKVAEEPPLTAAVQDDFELSCVQTRLECSDEGIEVHAAQSYVEAEHKAELTTVEDDTDLLFASEVRREAEDASVILSTRTSAQIEHKWRMSAANGDNNAEAIFPVVFSDPLTWLAACGDNPILVPPMDSSDEFGELTF